MFSPRDVLVVVDMQQVFAQGDWAAAGFTSATHSVRHLRDAFNGPVVLTRFVRDPSEPGAWHAYFDRWQAQRLPADDHAWDLAIEVRAGDTVVTLPTFSKWGEQLAGIARQDSRIVLCGVATECCVLATALGAADAGREVLVVTDACAGASESDHQRALDVLALMSPLVGLATTAELVG